jgi:hypothetical protein
MTTLPVHSRIGASSMHRWSACPGSVKLSQFIPSSSSKYAEEGTLAHEIAAEILQVRRIDKYKNLPEDMMPAVWVYANEIVSVTKEHPDAKLLVEHRFDLSKIHTGLYGTADAVIFLPSKKLLQVYDYKHGAGISVDVENNEQLMYYGLGALLSTGFVCENVELVVVQPRCDSGHGPIKRWRFNSVELIDFAADLKKFAAATEEANAPLVVGSHCRFCPAAASVCPKVREKALAIAKEEFSPQMSYDPEKLSKTLAALPVLENFVKSVREFAYAEAEQGRIPPGFKLVEKRAMRKWSDEKVVQQFLDNNFANSTIRECYTNPELKSPAQVEKVVGKDKLNHLMVSESSGLTLVEEADKRPAFKKDPTLDFKPINQ